MEIEQQTLRQQLSRHRLASSSRTASNTHSACSSLSQKQSNNRNESPITYLQTQGSSQHHIDEQAVFDCPEVSRSARLHPAAKAASSRQEFRHWDLTLCQSSLLQSAQLKSNRFMNTWTTTAALYQNSKPDTSTSIVAALDLTGGKHGRRGAVCAVTCTHRFQRLQLRQIVDRCDLRGRGPAGHRAGDEPLA